MGACMSTFESRRVTRLGELEKHARSQDTLDLDTLVNYCQRTWGLSYPVARDYARIVLIRMGVK